MKLLMVSSFAESLLTFRGELIESFLKRGYEVHVVLPRGGDDKRVLAQMETWGVEVHRVSLERTGTSPRRDVQFFVELLLEMKRLKPDVVFAYTVKPVVYGMLSAWLLRVPRRCALITGLGYAFIGERAGLISKVASSLYWIGLRCAHLVFFQNPDDKQLFEQRGLLPKRKQVSITNGSGIHLSKFSVAPFPQGEKIRFLLIARLLGDKGVREYVGAARKVLQIYQNAEFHLVGWIDENPDAIRQTELDSWVSEGVVQFHGRAEDVRPFLEQSHVYVLPSYREGTPRTVLEAMAMGRPIITTDAPGCRETVKNGENGYLVPVKDEGELMKAMVRLLIQPELIPAMGYRSREIAEEKYDVRRVNDEILNEIERVA